MSCKCSFLVILSIILLLPSLPAWTQEMGAPPKLAPIELLPATMTIEDITVTTSILGEETFRPKGTSMKLNLQDAIEIALERNYQVINSGHSLKQSLANLELTRSNYRGKFDLDARVDENIRTRTGGTFRIDPDKGLISDVEKKTDNQELFTIGPRYQQTFRNGSSLSISPQYQYIHDTDGAYDSSAKYPEGFKTDDMYDVDVRYNFPLNSRPRKDIETEIENSKLSTIQSDYDLYMRKQIITQQTISNYWNIIGMYVDVDIQKERLLQSRRIEFMRRVQYENENAAQVDVGLAQIDVMNNESTLISTEGRLRSSVESFNIILGLPVETKLELTDKLEVSPLPMTAKEYISLVTENNLELKSLRLSIRQAENSLGVARLGQQPDLTLSTFYQRDDEGTQDIGAALVFSWPFSDGGATKARVRGQTEALERQRISLWNQERVLIQESYSNLRNLELEVKRIGILEKNVERAYINMQNAEFRFKESGTISFRDMQDYQLDLAQSRQSLVNAQVSYNVAKANLMQNIHHYKPSEEVIPILKILD